MSKFKPEDRVRIVGSDGTEVLGSIIAINPEGNRVVIRDDDNVLHRENVEDIEMCEKAPVGFTFKVGDRVKVLFGIHKGCIGTIIDKVDDEPANMIQFDEGWKTWGNTATIELIKDEPTPSLKDSGNRREFDTGAVRDMAKGKGRCDLLPILSFSWLLGYKEGRVMANIETFKESGSRTDLKSAIKNLAESRDYDPNYGISECGFDLDRSVASMILDVSLQFEAGAEKYGEGNWQKGIPTNVYIDSAVRHYLKHLRGDTDEPHLRATTWNLLCCLWTVENMPELNTYAKEDEDDE